MLDKSLANHVANNIRRIEANAEFEDLAAMTDGLTNPHTPLVNVLTGKPGGRHSQQDRGLIGPLREGWHQRRVILASEIWPVLEGTRGRCYDQSQSLLFTT